MVYKHKDPTNMISGIPLPERAGEILVFVWPFGPLRKTG